MFHFLLLRNWMFLSASDICQLLFLTFICLVLVSSLFSLSASLSLSLSLILKVTSIDMSVRRLITIMFGHMDARTHKMGSVPYGFRKVHIRVPYGYHTGPCGWRTGLETPTWSFCGAVRSLQVACMRLVRVACMRLVRFCTRAFRIPIVPPQKRLWFSTTRIFSGKNGYSGCSKTHYIADFPPLI